MMKIILISLLVFLNSNFSFSQDQAKLDAIKSDSLQAYFKLMKQEEQLKAMFDSGSGSYLNSMSYLKDLYPEIYTDSAFIKLLDKMMKKNMDRALLKTQKLLKEDLVTLYFKYYTQKDINELLKFYRSETGQKIISITPTLSIELMEIIKAKSTSDYLIDIKKDQEEMMLEIQKIIEEKGIKKGQ